MIHWKGFDATDATWEPLDVLEGAYEAIREYWWDTYNAALPFLLPDTHYETFSAWTLETPQFTPLSPELDPDGMWSPIQDSDYSENETLLAIEESEMED